MKLPNRASKLLGWLAEMGPEGDLPLAAIAKERLVAESTLKLARDDLVAAGLLAVTTRPGRPSRYRLLDPADDPADSTQPTQPIHPADHPADPADLPRGGARPITTSSPPSNPAPSTGRAGAHTDPADPADHPADPADPADPGRVVEVGQAVVGWAVDEQRRLGKPPLDGALLGRIGSVAKRMSAGGVSAADLKLAVETLVDRDMTDLQAAHRRAQSASSAPIVPGRRAAASEVDALAAAAAESKRGRSPSLRPHKPGEFVEVWAFIAATWGTIPPPAEQAMWERQLRTFPVDGVIWALRELAIGGEHKRFAPTWGEVYRVGIPELRSRRRREADDLASQPEAE